MDQTFGEVRIEMLKMRLSKKNKDFNAVMASLDNIIAVQQQRIDTINKAAADVESLLRVL